MNKTKYIVQFEYSSPVEFDTLDKARKFLRENTCGQARIGKFGAWDDDVVSGCDTLGNNRAFTVTKIN